MSATPSAVSSNDTIQPKKPRSKVTRKSTRKPQAIQTAIIARRVQGQTKAQIARDLGMSVNTVTSIVELSDVESQIAEYRQTAMGLVPLAITAVETDLKFPGNGSLGLRVLESTGVLGEDAIDAVRRNSRRQSGAINVLVQPGAVINVGSNDDRDNDNRNHAELDAAGNNNDASPRPAIDAPRDGTDATVTNNSTTTVNNKVTATVGRHKHVPPTGKQPRDGVGRK